MNIHGNATHGQEIIERPKDRVACIKERRVRGRHLQSIDDQLPGEYVPDLYHCYEAVPSAQMMRRPYLILI
jgi:hypothetical protein